MNEEYLNKVLIFLQQELPQFKQDMRISGALIRFTLPEGQAFQPYFEAVQQGVTASVNRIRKRESDLNFSVFTKTQERDFKIRKQDELA